MKEIQVKRVYDPPEAGDGQRVLVDRLWPRGLSKEKAGIHLWVRDQENSVIQEPISNPNFFPGLQLLIIIFTPPEEGAEPEAEQT